MDSEVSVRSIIIIKTDKRKKCFDRLYYLFPDVISMEMIKSTTISSYGPLHLSRSPSLCRHPTQPP